MRILLRLDEDLRQTPEGIERHRQRILNQDRSERAAKDDHGGGRLEHLADISTLQPQAKQDAADREHQTAEGCLIHEGSYTSPAG